MENSVLSGIIVTLMAGLIMGASPAPLKFLHVFKFEHFGFISMFVSLLLVPWAITLTYCPDLVGVFAAMDWGLVLKANMFSMAWGIAQVLAMLCFIRIGVSLTYGILCAIGACVGVITPMIFKASGIFSEAPGIFSTAGIIVLGGVIMIILGVYLASIAGLLREKVIRKAHAVKRIERSGNFRTGLIMVIIGGILSTGWGFAFAYSQGPIVEVLTSHGASDMVSKIAVWAFVLFGAAIINILYPVYLLSKNKSWKVLTGNAREIMLSVLYGLLFFIPSVLLGKGMLLLGTLGASVGVGITQSALIVGGQIVGFASGEWHGVHGKSRKYIYSAIIILIISMLILGLGNMAIQN